jgi:hypothetical protein
MLQQLDQLQDHRDRRRLAEIKGKPHDYYMRKPSGADSALQTKPRLMYSTLDNASSVRGASTNDDNLTSISRMLTNLEPPKHRRGAVSEFKTQNP